MDEHHKGPVHLSLRNAAGFLIREVDEVCSTRFERELSDFGFGVRELRVLWYVAHYDANPSQQMIADAMRVSKNSVSLATDVLVDGGALERRPDPTSRRQVQLHVTPKGWHHIETWKERQAVIRRDIFGALSDAEYDTLCTLLLRLLEA